MGLSNQALSLLATSPLLAVFEALPISMCFFVGFKVSVLARESSNGVKVTTTVDGWISLAQHTGKVTRDECSSGNRCKVSVVAAHEQCELG